MLLHEFGLRRVDYGDKSELSRSGCGQELVSSNGFDTTGRHDYVSRVALMAPIPSKCPAKPTTGDLRRDDGAKLWAELLELTMRRAS